MSHCSVKINQPGGHKCAVEQVGGEAVFTCPLCPEYERRIDLKTGKMTVEGGSSIQHHGFYVKPGLDVSFNQN